MDALLAAVAAAAAIAAAPPPALGSRCGPEYAALNAHPFWFRAADGTRLDGATFGKGRATVLFATEYPADLCRWLGFAPAIARDGFRVFLFDFRGLGLSGSPKRASARNAYLSDLAGAAIEARRRGNGRLLLLGASLGGTVVLTGAPRLVPQPAAVISLSGEASLTGRFPGSGLDALAAVRRLRAPLLIVGSRADSLAPETDLLRLKRAAGSREKRTLVFPGTLHGWDVLYGGPYRRRASAAIISFLRRHEPGATWVSAGARARGPSKAASPARPASVTGRRARSKTPRSRVPRSAR